MVVMKFKILLRPNADSPISQACLGWNIIYIDTWEINFINLFTFTYLIVAYLFLHTYLLKQTILHIYIVYFTCKVSLSSTYTYLFIPGGDWRSREQVLSGEAAGFWQAAKLKVDEERRSHEQLHSDLVSVFSYLPVGLRWGGVWLWRTAHVYRLG